MLYDDQADTFDERAGIPPDSVQAIARAIGTLAKLESGGSLLEVGCGTGLLSIPLLEFPIDYVGFDRSPEMIRVFRDKLARIDSSPDLYVSDGNDAWPGIEGTFDAIFSSRAIHHIDIDHAVSEIVKALGKDGGLLIVGQVKRPNDSVKSVMRRYMRDLLKRQGYSGRSGGNHAERLFTALEARGGTRREPLTAAEWTSTHAPVDSIEAWRTKDGLAGLELPPKVKTRTLDEVREWATEQFGSIEEPLEQIESYELSAIVVR